MDYNQLRDALRAHTTITAEVADFVSSGPSLRITDGNLVAESIKSTAYLRDSDVFRKSTNDLVVVDIDADGIITNTGSVLYDGLSFFLNGEN